MFVHCHWLLLAADNPDVTVILGLECMADGSVRIAAFGESFNKMHACMKQECHRIVTMI